MSNDDFETFDSPEQMPQQTVSAAEIFKNNPSLKIFSIVAVVGVVVAALLMFGGGEEELPVSRVGNASEVAETPGSNQLSPEYENALKEKDKQNLQEALQQGKSVFPTPIASKEERIEAPPVEEEVEDPLKVWRDKVEQKSVLTRRSRTVEPLLSEGADKNGDASASADAEDVAPIVPKLPIQQEPKTVYVKQQMPTSPTPEDVAQRTQLIQKQMATILETKVPKAAHLLSLGDVGEILAQKNASQVAAFSPTLTPVVGMQENNGMDEYQDPEAPATPEPIVMPGDVAYAQMMTEANSDISGPVLAYIASGPLSGARALGSFSSTDTHIVLTFNTAVVKKKQYAINAYAVDPETTLTGMATDVDNHYFSRVILPAAAKFLEGFADAVKDSGNTTVTVNGETVTSESSDLDTEEELLAGASEGIKELSDIIDEEAPDQPTVRVRAGTRFGLLFMQPVYEVE